MLKTFAAFFSVFLFIFSAQAQTHSDSLVHQKFLFSEQTKLALRMPAAVISQNFTTKNLPFFCDKEYKLEKITKIPFRFRLGSVEYCNKMEGKNQ